MNDASTDNRKPASLLLVDDEPNVLNALKRLFRPDGYIIYTAHSGAEGLDVLKRETVDLIISDMRMPQMDGAEFFAQAAKLWPEIVRILLTGYSDNESTIAAINKGKIYSYCCKPWEDQDLKLLVCNALEQKRLRTELDSKRAEMVAMVENLNDAVITLDENGTVHSANPAVQQIFGYKPAELVGQNVSLLMPEDHRSMHDDFLENYLQTGEANIVGVNREVPGRHKNGEIIPMQLAVSEYRVDNRRYFAGTLHDLREQKRLIAEINAARERAESASRIKSDFLAAMSHELRTPMNGVISMVEVLEQTRLMDDQMEMVELIRESASSLLGIIEDILDFSKIEAGKLELEHEPLSIENLTDKVCTLLCPIAEKKQVVLTLFVAPDIPQILQGDELRLRQILTNLIYNAIKFSSGQALPGQVAIRTVVHRSEHEKVWVEFSVSDNGIGMDSATQARLFRPFEQAGPSTSRCFGGTGLGLAIVRRLVQMMDGEIKVQSAPDSGSTFTVRLPFSMPPQKEASVSPVSGLPCLVIGQEDGLIEDVAVQLTHAGAQVIRVSDIEQARQQTSAQPDIHVWILDDFDVPVSLDALHAATRVVQPGGNVRILLIGRGRRRKPRWEAPDLLRLDGNLVTRRTILEAVAIAAGRTEASQTNSTIEPDHEIFKAPSIEEAVLQNRLILVAEDNENNQRVILRQLSLLGFAAKVANDGRAALNLWKTGKYALLLTDMQMPQMDGCELTASIRYEEMQAQTGHIPIIALTANALPGEAKRCRSAGMDDYLPKPVSLSQLEAILNQWLPPAASSHHPTPCPATKQALDLNVLQELIGDDPKVVSDFVQDFRTYATCIAGDIMTAYASQRFQDISSAGHKLKSSARSVGAFKLSDVCESIEQAGKKADKKALAELITRFKAEMSSIENYFAARPNATRNSYGKISGE